MKKLDRRIVRTRRALSEAVVRLVLEKGYDRLTVIDITRIADIGYPTFYRHYRSIDDLLETVMSSLVDDLNQVINEQTTPFDEAVATFRHIADHPDIYRACASLPRKNVASQQVIKRLEIMFRERFQLADSSSVSLEFAMNHIINSSIVLLRLYLDNLDRYTPEEIAAMYVDLVFGAPTSVTIAPREDWLKRLLARQTDGNRSALPRS